MIKAGKQLPVGKRRLIVLRCDCTITGPGRQDRPPAHMRSWSLGPHIVQWKRCILYSDTPGGYRALTTRNRGRSIPSTRLRLAIRVPLGRYPPQCHRLEVPEKRQCWEAPNSGPGWIVAHSDRADFSTAG